MRCPHCDQWNRPNLPRCVRCGQELNAPARPSWRDTFKDDPAKEYIQVDDDGDEIVSPDDREVLAAEMAELKERKEAGEQLQQQMLEDAATRQNVSAQVHGRQGGGVAKDPFFGLPEEGVDRDAPAPAPDAAPEAPAAQGDTPFRRTRDPRGTRVVLAPDTWEDSRSYDPLAEEARIASAVYRVPQDVQGLPSYPGRRAGRRRIIRTITWLMALGVLCLVAVFGYSVYAQMKAAEEEKNRPLITASMVDDQAAHTILIPGEEGETIFISNEEITNSYPVIGGFATIEIPDYLWYESDDSVTEETRTVTLLPYRKTSSGRQKPMDPISYDISIPLSPITLITPTAKRTTVAMAMYSIELKVRPDSQVVIMRPTATGSEVLANVSDTVNEKGELTYNATVQPIGDNVFEIHVRSPYCRENVISVVLYRDVQEIPLDLSATTYATTNNKVVPITCKTIPGAEIKILTPHSDLKITELDETGEFTFNAIFDHIGDNLISITASYPGRKTSQLDYSIYYVPGPDEYTRYAWPLWTANDYAELMGNLSFRAKEHRVYVAAGEVDHFVTEDGTQMAVMYCAGDGTTQPVLLENRTRTVWEKGKHYTIYCDAYSSYNGMPWLIARYTY